MEETKETKRSKDINIEEEAKPQAEQTETNENPEPQIENHEPQANAEVEPAIPQSKSDKAIPITEAYTQPTQMKPPKTAPLQQRTERSFKTMEQIYSKPSTSKQTQSLQFFRTADQFDRKVVHDQINNSHAKQHYSFPKAQRFSKPKSSYCSTQFYESQLQTQLGKRSAAIGFGTKSDFTKKDKFIPPPTAYDVLRQNINGVKFAFGRSETAIMGPLGFMNKNPGPGNYTSMQSLSNIKYTFGERTSAKHIYIQSTTPAPGTYEIGGISSKGQYFVGKYKGSGAPMISPASSQSVRYKRLPGPGSYNPPGDIGEKRMMLPSKYLNQSGYRFSSEPRKTQQLKNIQYPGPGTYQLPSEFGDFEYPPL